MLSWPRPSSCFLELLANTTFAEIIRRLIRFIAFYPVVFSDMVSLAVRIHLPAFIVNFCLKTGPHARKGFPSFRAALVQQGDAPPCDGRSGFVRADRNHKAGNDAGPNRKGNLKCH